MWLSSSRRRIWAVHTSALAPKMRAGRRQSAGDNSIVDVMCTRREEEDVDMRRLSGHSLLMRVYARIRVEVV